MNATTAITQDHHDLALLRAFETEVASGEGISGNYARLLKLGWIEEKPLPPHFDIDGETTGFYFQLLPAGDEAGNRITAENCELIDSMVERVIGWA